MTCNGCRVLRRGCSDNCAIRPCLRWIRSPDAQGNATVFLAKFYGRAGLTNIITAGPEHYRAALFRSLLYEACGRMLNTVYGSAGLLSSGNWQLCEAAVDSVLRGTPIAQTPLATTAVPPLRSCDIRHVARRDAGLHRKATSSRAQFKRSGSAYRSSASSESGTEIIFSQPSGSSIMVDFRREQPLNSWAPPPRYPCHEYSASYDNGTARKSVSNASVDSVDVSHVSQSEPEPPRFGDERVTDGLDLRLGLDRRHERLSCRTMTTTKREV